MWLYIFQGMGFGFAAAAQPGPFQTYLISQSLAKGWRKAIPAALAPLISDGPIITLCLFVLSQIPAWLQRFLYIAGGLFILYLAYGMYTAWRSFVADIPVNDSETVQSVWKAALMNILNPSPYIYWSLVTGPILMRGWREAQVYGVGFLAGFYVTLITGLAIIILVFGIARELGPKMNRTLLAVSAIALFFFGLYQLSEGFF